MNDLVSRAREFATECHGGQIRKYDGTPYTMHLYRVSELVSMAHIPNTSTAVAASWLHDTLEDTNTSEDDLWNNFGFTISATVYGLSDLQTPDKGNRTERKMNCASKLCNIGSEFFATMIHTIKAADLIDNGRSIMKHDPKFARVYFAEIRDMIHNGSLRQAYRPLLSGLVDLTNQYYCEFR